MDNQTVIVWFRNDLRLHDHIPLNQALQRYDHVIPVYCFDTRQFRTHSLGFPKSGPFRTKFLLESVADLRENLRRLGSDLVVRIGHPEKEIAKICRQVKTNDVYAYKGISREDHSIEMSLKQSLGKRRLRLFQGTTMILPDDLPYKLRELPDIFTAFRKSVEGRNLIAEPLPPPQNMAPLPNEIEAGFIPTMAELKLSEMPSDPRAVMEFSGGEAFGLQRVHNYIWSTRNIQSYKDTRNQMLGENYSSKFSPWLANGSLSARYIYHEIRRFEKEVLKNDSTFWLIFELLWRDYFHFVAQKYGKKLHRSGGIRDKKGPWRYDKELFQSWREGKTGVPFIDANMRELNLTGFMSNRGRQNVASFLVKDLNVDWRMGAAYFESMLIDFDYSSNWGNWNYVAGVGNDPRENRYFNVLYQAQRYDPNGDYVRHWLPELSAIKDHKVHQVFRLTEYEQNIFNIHLGANYPWAITMPAAWIEYY